MHRKLDTVHTRIHTYIHAYMHRCTDTLRIPVHTHMCTHTHTHTTTHTITRTITRPHTHTYTYIHTHTPTHTYTHTYRQTEIRTDRHTDMKTHRHTYIHGYLHVQEWQNVCAGCRPTKKLYICRLHWHPTSPTQCRSNLNRWHKHRHTMYGNTLTRLKPIDMKTEAEPITNNTLTPSSTCTKVPQLRI